MFSRKGQSALEYLMTYGWALIVIVIVIGALMLLIGNPSSTATGCSQGGAIIYKAQNLNGTDYNIVLLNGTGMNLDADNYSISLSSGVQSSTDSDPWNAGTQQVFSFTGVTPDSSNQITVTVQYVGAAGPQTETKTCTVR